LEKEGAVVEGIHGEGRGGGVGVGMDGFGRGREGGAEGAGRSVWPTMCFGGKKIDREKEKLRST